MITLNTGSSEVARELHPLGAPVTLLRMDTNAAPLTGDQVTQLLTDAVKGLPASLADADTGTLTALLATLARVDEGVRAGLYPRAVADAVKSTRYGHLAKVARDYGISRTHLARLVAEEYPDYQVETKADRAAKVAPPKAKGRRKAA